MTMQMQASRQISASPDKVWKALNDPTILRSCIPGCDSFEPDGENRYAVSAAIRIGPVSARFSGTVTLADIVEGVSYSLSFDASGGVAGFGKGRAEVALSPADGGTTLTYAVKSQIGGKLAQLGQRLIDGAAKSMADDFFRRFEQAVQTQEQAASGSASDLPPADVARKGPSWIWLAGLAAAVAVVVSLMAGR